MIKIERPPNFDQIVAVFPRAVHHGVLFAYGEDIYNPSDVSISKALLAHEYRHCARQWQKDPKVWWTLYLTDPEFRYQEELVAHLDEYKAQSAYASRNYRRVLLKSTAKRLIAPLYEYGVGIERAIADIKKLAR